MRKSRDGTRDDTKIKLKFRKKEDGTTSSMSLLLTGAILASLMFSACNGVVNTVEESEAYTAEIAHIRNS